MPLLDPDAPVGRPTPDELADALDRIQSGRSSGDTRSIRLVRAEIEALAIELQLTRVALASAEQRAEERNEALQVALYHALDSSDHWQQVAESNAERATRAEAREKAANEQIAMLTERSRDDEKGQRR